MSNDLVTEITEAHARLQGQGLSRGLTRSKLAVAFQVTEDQADRLVTLGQLEAQGRA